MVRADNRYSRFVQRAKIVFPLVALGLLSTLFLFSRNLDPSQAIPFADIDVEKIAREQRLASPKFSGVTSDGSEISLTARSAVPDVDNPRNLSAEDVHAVLETEAGLVIDIRSEHAVYNGTTEDLELSDDVNIRTSTGFTLKTEKLIANTQETTVLGPVAVSGTGPDGTIRADSFEVRPKGASQLLVFKGRVKLVYKPQD